MDLLYSLACLLLIASSTLAQYRSPLGMRGRQNNGYQRGMYNNGGFRNNNGYENGRNNENNNGNGRENGYGNGRENGYGNGRENGYSNGRENGYGNGRENGYDSSRRRQNYRRYEDRPVDQRRNQPYDFGKC